MQTEKRGRGKEDEGLGREAILVGRGEGRSWEKRKNRKKREKVVEKKELGREGISKGRG